MESVQVFLRSSKEFSAIICRLPNMIEFHNIKIYNYLPYDKVISEVASLRNTNTQVFVSFAKKYDIKSIVINVKGPIKEDTMLDLNIIRENGIVINDIRDVTMPTKDLTNFRNALIRTKIFN